MTLISFISALSFYLFPISLGYALIKLKNIRFRDENPSETPFAVKLLNQFRYFTYGALYIYATAFVLFIAKKVVPDMDFTLFLNSFILISVVLSIPIVAYGLVTYLINIKHFKLHDLVDLLFLILLALVTYGVWRWDSGLNTTLNWDIYHHQTLATIIQRGNFDFVTSNLSDSFQFDGYSTLFHTQIAIVQKIFTPNILAFWWFIELIHLFTTIAASFALAYAVTKNRWAGYIGAIIGALVFESAVSYTSLFLIPQNLSATVTVAYIASIINRYAESKDSSKLLTIDFGIYAVYILLNHFVIGTLGVFLVAFSKVYLLLKDVNKGPLMQKGLFIASFLLLLIVPLAASQVDLNSINRGEAAFFNYTLEEKFNFMKQFYGYTLLVFLPLGYLYTIGEKRHSYILLLIITNGILSLIVAHIPYSLKFYTVGRFAVHTTMALGVWFIIQYLNKYMRFVALVLLYAVLLMMLTINVSDYKQVPGYKEISTHITPGEVEAAQFLRSKYTGQNVLLLSDPATMHLLEGLSGINTPGGSYTGLDTRELLSQVYFIRNENMTNTLFQVHDGVDEGMPDKILLAVGGRFSKWQLGGNEEKKGIHWNVWSPFDLSSKDLEDHDFIYYLRTNLKYKEVFSNESIIIFEVDKPANMN